MKAESTTMTIRTKEEKKRALLELAKEKECSLSKYMNKVIDAHLKKLKK